MSDVTAETNLNNFETNTRAPRLNPFALHRPIPILVKEEVQENTRTENDLLEVDPEKEESQPEAAEVNSNIPNSAPMEVDGPLPLVEQSSTAAQGTLSDVDDNMSTNTTVPAPPAPNAEDSVLSNAIVPPPPAPNAEDSVLSNEIVPPPPAPNEEAFEFPEQDEETSSTDWRDAKSHKDIFVCALDDDEDMLKDVTFLVGPEEEPISTHKLLLALFSRKFYYALYQDPTTKYASRFLLPDVSPNTFRHLLRYIYYRHLEVDMDEALDVLKLAYRFKIQYLVTKCMAHLRTGLNSSNAADILQVAWRFPDSRLKRCALAEIASNAKKVLRTEGFLKLDLDPLCDLLETNLNVDEASIFLAAKRWAENSIRKKNQTEDVKITGEDIRKELGRALFLIRFHLFSGQEFSRHVTKTGILNMEELVLVLETLVKDYVYEPSMGAQSPFSFEPRMRRTVVAAATSSTASDGDGVAGVVRDSINETTNRPSSEPREIREGDTTNQKRQREMEPSAPFREGRAPGDRAEISSREAGDEGRVSAQEQCTEGDGERPIKRTRLVLDETDRSENESTTGIGIAVVDTNTHSPSPMTQNSNQDAEPAPSTSGWRADISRRSSSEIEDLEDQEMDDYLFGYTGSIGSDQEEQSQLLEPIINGNTEGHEDGDNDDNESRVTERLSDVQGGNLLTVEQYMYILNNISINSENGNNLKNVHERFKCILEMEDSQQIQIIREDDPVVINTTSPLVHLEFPHLTDYHINFLSNHRTVKEFKTYVNNLNVSSLLLFREFKSIQDLEELFNLPGQLEGEQDEINLTIVINGVTVLKADFRENSLILSRMDKSIEPIMEGMYKSNVYVPRLRSIHLEECKTSLTLFPNESLENITLRKVKVGAMKRTEFLRKCKNLKEFSCTDLGNEDIDFGLDLRLLEPEGTNLRRVALGKAKLGVMSFNPFKTSNNQIEELYLDNCQCNEEFTKGFNWIFPNLKKLKIKKIACRNIINATLTLLLNALKIDSLEWVGVYELGLTSSTPGPKKGRGKKNLTPHEPESVISVMEMIQILEGAGFDAPWINSGLKTFILERKGIHQNQGKNPNANSPINQAGGGNMETASGDSVPGPSQTTIAADNLPELSRSWKGKKIHDSIKVQEFDRLDFEQFGWTMFYEDFRLFRKLN